MSEIDYEQLKKFPRDLPVQLNDHELEQYGMQLAVAVRAVELTEEKKKADATKWSTLIKSQNQEVKRLADARAKGEELRPVMCAERLKGNVIEIIRLDTKAVVDTRPADMTDLQQTLPGMDESPTTPGERTTSGGTVIQLVPNIDPGGDAVPHAAESEPDVGESDAASDPTPVGELHDGDGNVVGEGVESSTGDGVFIGEALACPACGEAITEDDERTSYEGAVVHAACKPGDETPEETQVERDRRVRQEEIDAEAAKAGTATIGEQSAKKRRERSAKKNGEKKGKK